MPENGVQSYTTQGTQPEPADLTIGGVCSCWLKESSPPSLSPSLSVCMCVCL